MAKKTRRQRQNANAGKNANNSNRARAREAEKEDIDEEAPTLILRQDGEIEKQAPVANGGLKSMVVASPKGLMNLGNTCFFNSVLQNLCRTSGLIHALQKTKRQSTLRIDAEDVESLDVNLPSPFKLTDALLNFLVTMNHDSPAADARAGGKARKPARARTESPRQLFNQICAISSRFRGYQQQDSQELLHALLDGVKDEEIKRRKQGILSKLHLLGKRAKDVDPALKKRVKKYGQVAVGMPTVVDMLFSGTLVSSVLCDECGQITQVTEEFIDISLPIVDVAPSHHPQNNATGKRHQKSQEAEQNGTAEASSSPLSKHGKKKLKKQAKRNRRQQRNQDHEHGDEGGNEEGASKPTESQSDDIVAKLEELSIAESENACGDSVSKDATEKKDNPLTDFNRGDGIPTSDDSEKIETLAVSIVRNVLDKSIEILSPELRLEAKAELRTQALESDSLLKTQTGEDLTLGSYGKQETMNEEDMASLNSATDAINQVCGTAGVDCGAATNRGQRRHAENEVNGGSALKNEEGLINERGTVWHVTDASVADATEASYGRTYGGAIPESSVTRTQVRPGNGAAANGNGLNMDSPSDQSDEVGENSTSQVANTGSTEHMAEVASNADTENSLTSTRVANPNVTNAKTSSTTSDIATNLVASNDDKPVAITDAARYAMSNATITTSVPSVTDEPPVPSAPQTNSSVTNVVVSATDIASGPNESNGSFASNTPRTNLSGGDDACDTLVASVTTLPIADEVGEENVVYDPHGGVAGGGSGDNVPCDTTVSLVTSVTTLPVENVVSNPSDAANDEPHCSRNNEVAISNHKKEGKKVTSQMPDDAEMSPASNRSEPSSGNDEKEESPAGDLESGNRDVPSLFETPAKQPGRCFTTYCSKLPTSISQRYEPEHQECSIQSCLHKFTMAEMLTGNNKFGCDECTRRQCKGEAKPKTVYCNASKQMLIKTPPLILTLHLKRFQQSGRGLRKFSRNVTIPVELDFSPFCSTDAESHLDSREQLRYRIFGLVEHSGSMSRGHYTSYVNVRPENDNISKQLDARFEDHDTAPSMSSTDAGDDDAMGTWYHISDTHVAKATEERALNCNAYLVFYERIF